MYHQDECRERTYHGRVPGGTGLLWGNRMVMVRGLWRGWRKRWRKLLVTDIFST